MLFVFLFLKMSVNCVSHVIPKVFGFLLVILLINDTTALTLRAYISQRGLHGEIDFVYNNETSITVRPDLRTTAQYPDGVFKWTVHEFPVDYRDLSDRRCSDKHLGREIIDLTEELGYLIVPGNETEFTSKNKLLGSKGLWGRSLVLEAVEEGRVMCASIVAADERVQEKHAMVKFHSPIAGTLHFKWIYSREHGDMDSFLQADLYHIKKVTTTDPPSDYTHHKWKLYVTEIFDNKKDHEDDCDVLQSVFDPENAGEGRSIGDLDNRFGPIQIATNANTNKVKKLYKDGLINMLRSDMEVTTRSLYVVIFDDRHPDDFLACSRLRIIHPKSYKAIINMDGIIGSVNFTQLSPFDPTWSSFHLQASDGEYESNLRFLSSMLSYNIMELPPKMVEAKDYRTVCNTTGAIYNPTGLDLKNLPPPGMGTQDQYPVGDLYGKYKDRSEKVDHHYLLPGLANELRGEYWDVFLPLQGVSSVAHRAMVLERRPPKPGVCGTILSYEHGTDYQTLMSSAQVVFRYPLVGNIIFRQPLGRPWEDTTVIVESLIHADGATVNNTFEHRWAIHEHPPGKDYYNWTARCLSAGKMMEPRGLKIEALEQPESNCWTGVDGLCRIGDLNTRHGTLSIAGRKSASAMTRRLFTDTVVSLAGRLSVMKRSVVIYDDHGPVARGERMACSIITGLHRRKAVATDWFSNGTPGAAGGRLEITQQSPYDVVNVQVLLDSLDAVYDYKIHPVPVEKDLEFPCEGTTLYGVYNPYNISKYLTPPPTKGTVDQYPLGDMGAKHGLLTGLKKLNTAYNETQMSLFGPYSILGRSLVIHKNNKDRRWSCSSIERGYSPSEAREIRAIASFHHPGGFAYGFVRMTQLIHNDGSASDTVIEVKLRYPGVRDRNLTHNHKWEIWVNPVGVDAAVKVTGTRCVAGGYRWNPYFTQLADPLNHDLYSQECGADNPLRCDVGDITARLGVISVGGDRQMFMDSNFPLEGTVSAMGRSIVVFGPEYSSERLACANIQPDKDIIKYVNVMKSPHFVLGQFLEDVRRVLGVPEWMVSVDARRTRTLHSGSCIQLLLHFAGPDANKLELDFTRLLSSGHLDSPSIYIPGYIDPKRKKKLSYRQCGVVDPNENTRKKTSFFFSSSSSGRNWQFSSKILYWITFLNFARIFVVV